MAREMSSVDTLTAHGQFAQPDDDRRGVGVRARIAYEDWRDCSRNGSGVPPLRQRVESDALGFWVDDDFRLGSTSSAPGWAGAAATASCSSRARRCNRSSGAPVVAFHLIENYDGSCAVVSRIHHASPTASRWSG
jgi:hypothetical protein